MENCIFCKIANGEIPSATLYEDEDFRVILDLGPVSGSISCKLSETSESMDAPGRGGGCTNGHIQHQ